MLLALVAAQLATAHPSNLRALVTADDVPDDLVTRNKVQTVGIALTVGPDGKARRCTVEATSGNSKLDSYTCKLAARRAKFSPSPMYLVWRTHFDWWVGDGYPPKSNYANLALKVAALPTGLHSPVSVNLTFAVDQAGNMSDCRTEAEREPVVLVPVACEQLAKTFRPQPARSEDGSAVASEQEATVLFETK
jgi:hypothetical protein